MLPDQYIFSLKSKTLLCLTTFLDHVNAHLLCSRCKKQMCCDLVESVRSREHCEIQPEKRMHFFCFQLFWEYFTCYNFGTTGPIQVGFSAKRTSPNKDFKQIENWKMAHVRLPTDRITKYQNCDSMALAHVILVHFWWHFCMELCASYQTKFQLVLHSESIIYYCFFLF